MTAIATSNPSWAIRPAIPEDIPFIYSTWLNSYRVDSFLGGSVPKTTFFDNYHHVVDRILSVSEASVACLPEDPKVILGYLVHEETPARALHYCFIKEPFRRLGIASALCERAFGGAGALPIQYSHETASGLRALRFNRRKASGDFFYNPFLLFQKI